MIVIVVGLVIAIPLTVICLWVAALAAWGYFIRDIKPRGGGSPVVGIVFLWIIGSIGAGVSAALISSIWS